MRHKIKQMFEISSLNLIFMEQRTQMVYFRLQQTLYLKDI